MPDDRDIDAPVSLAGLFGSVDSDSDSENAGNTDAFQNSSEEQKIEVCGKTLKVRQFCFHTHNANRVWPGTFNLLEYYMEEDEMNKNGGGDFRELLDPEKWVLELGTATGLLAIRLSMEGGGGPLGCRLVTSDVSDGGEVMENVRYNYELNGLGDVVPRHVEHSWGTGWGASVDAATSSAAGTMTNCKVNSSAEPFPSRFNIILASDILLYCKAYPALVETLKELMPYEDTDSGEVQKFVMSWNRRYVPAFICSLV